MWNKFKTGLMILGAIDLVFGTVVMVASAIEAYNAETSKYLSNSPETLYIPKDDPAATQIPITFA